MNRPLQFALLISAACHAVLVFAGLDALDSKPLALGAGMGPRGEMQVVALTPDQAAQLLARRGPARIPMLAEAGGVGRPSLVEPTPLSAPRPTGPEGLGVGGGPTLLELGAGRGGSADAAPASGSGALGAPEVLPAAPSPVAGAPADPSVAATDDVADVSEGPDEVGAAELAGSEGQSAADAGAADGDRAIGLDAATADALLTFRAVPDYPSALAAAGIGGTTEFEFTVDDRGRVGDVRRLGGTGNAILDANAERALRRWRFDAAAVAARGWLGRRWRVAITFDDDPR